MHLKFEHLAATSMLGRKDSPPRNNGKIQFDRRWEQQAFGLAIALAKKGHYEWEDFRQGLIKSIAEWERTHDTTDKTWDYYERWLIALERLAVSSGVIDQTELNERTEKMTHSSACKFSAHMTK
jgi:nitrile hydratase accessory protein